MDNGIFLRVVGYIYFFCRKWKIISGGTSYQTIKQNNTKKHKNKQNTKLEWDSIWQHGWLSNWHKKWKKETIPTFALLYLLVTWASWKSPGFASDFSKWAKFSHWHFLSEIFVYYLCWLDKKVIRGQNPLEKSLLCQYHGWRSLVDSPAQKKS